MRTLTALVTVMKRVQVLAIVLATATLIAPMTFGQSSGSFNFSSNPMQCVLDGSSGTLSGGATVSFLKTTMKTNSGSGNVFVVTPSAVVGLLTDVTISSKQTGSTVSSSAQVGVDFQVTVTPLSGQSNPVVIPSAPVTYEDRFIQISTNLFNAISTQCLANPDGSGGCFLTFNESTLGAHSFNWVVTNLQSGDYGLTVQWKPSSLVQGIGSTASCVGPVNLTVTQNKIFSPSAGIQF